MTKDTMKESAAAAEVLLFDDWFDAIEDGVRARVRGFIETMLEEELSGVERVTTTTAQASDPAVTPKPCACSGLGICG